MQNPITRALTALEVLQAHDRVSGAELAERLQVDLRTVQRYIAKLRELNIPVEASPGVGGAYRIRPGFRLPPLLLTNEEAFAVSLGLRALSQIGLSAFAPATEGARAKLSRVLPAELRHDLHSLDEAVALKPNSWSVSASAEHVIAIARAIRQRQRICFAYEARHSPKSQRQIEPYALLHTDERWYLVGRCLNRLDLRTFRLDRMEKIEVLPETFERPENFDPEQYLADRLPFLQADHKIDLWIDMPFEQAQHDYALWRVSMEAEGGGTRVRCSRDDLDFFAAMLLSTRRRIVVRSPDALKETFQALAREATSAANAQAG